jgi:hypothetical protein
MTANASIDSFGGDKNEEDKHGLMGASLKLHALRFLSLAYQIGWVGGVLFRFRGRVLGFEGVVGYCDGRGRFSCRRSPEIITSSTMVWLLVVSLS